MIYRTCKQARRKLGPCFYTSLPRTTCPDSCRFKKGRTCYYWWGFGGRYNKLHGGKEEIAEMEVKAISSVPVTLPLRLHMGGDFVNTQHVRRVVKATLPWKEKGLPVWTYTARWKAIPRDAFGHVSVLASVPNRNQAQLAESKGYSSFLAVRNPEGFRIGGDFICPSPDIPCTECRECLEQAYSEPRVVLARLHGNAVVTNKIRKLGYA